MKVDSSASYFLRQIVPAVLVAAAIGGCSAAGEASGERTIDDASAPFTFRVPADFTEESVDDFDTRGEVLAAAGIDKLDVIALRRLGPGQRVPRGDVPHRVQGEAVTSRLHEVPGSGFAIECQWRPDRRDKVLDACRTAVGSIARR
jgi:hypothetical protein